MKPTALRFALCALLIGAASVHVRAQPRQPLADPSIVGVEAATDAYLATMPADARARSNAYFEGGFC
jgi:hypothetical protein